MKQRRFSCAVVTDQAEPIAVVQLERNVLQRADGHPLLMGALPNHEAARAGE
jgi:hypothetical protein